MKRSMIDPDEALRRTLDLAARPTSEFVTLDDALGRFLGADIHTPWDLPAHDNSAMDGYAIRAADTADATGVHPVRLTIVGSVFAGTRPTAIVGPGQAVRIMTGAVIPAGADTVVRQEATRAGEGVVDVRIASDRGNNVRLRGETLRRDELVLRVGTKVTSQEIALLAAFGRCQVPVARRPTVHVVTCGDELHDAHEAADDLTVDSNGPMIAAMAREADAIAYRSGPVKDDLEQLRAHLLQVLSTVDVLITIGGASVGERDLVVDALRAHGAELVFHTVALKPGKPVGLFILREKPVFVLPGNPAACSMTFDRLVRPFLLAVQGVPREQVSRPRLPAILANDVHKQPGLTYYLRGWAELALGGLQVRLPPRQSSGQLTAGLEGNAVAIIPAGPGTVFAGTPVEIELLKPPHVAPRPPILAFAGYSGSGKTTALTALISRLSARGVRVAALKHDAHEFQLDREGKDTAKFSAAGATAVGIASASRRAVIATTSRATTLAELIATITVEVDVILVEGYKHDDIPKIVVHSDGIRELSPRGPGVLAVISDSACGVAVPVFSHGDDEALEAFVLSFIRRSV